MDNLWSRASVLMLTAGLALGPSAHSQGNPAAFISPDVSTATGIPYPVNTTATGMVSLLVSLDASANVQNVQVAQDTPPLTSAVQAAVQNWTFNAASFHGQPAAGSLTVSVVFNPFNPGATELAGMTIASPQAAPATSTVQFTPPQIAEASFAVYPPNSLAVGTVVLSVTVDKREKVVKVRVVRGAAVLTPAAVSAVKTWKYKAATLNTQPVAGKIIVAFVFQRNLS
jgi:outer membrane biosynthesis protein TonB